MITHNICFHGEKIWLLFGIIKSVISGATSYDAQCKKRALLHFADNIGPDHRAHLCSLIWAFSVRRHILQYPLIL